MLRFLLALFVCSASSLKTTPAQSALRLRGGGDLATPLLYATSVIGGATGVSCTFVASFAGCAPKRERRRAAPRDRPRDRQPRAPSPELLQNALD